MRLTTHRVAAATLTAALAYLLLAPESHAPTRYAVKDFGTLSNGTLSIATGINGRGQVSGVAFLPDNETARAVVGSENKLYDLGTLGGSVAVATAISDAPQAIGASFTEGDENVRAFVCDRDGMRDLGSLGGDASVAQGINSKGVIIGVSQTRTGDPHAFRYENGEWRDIFPASVYSEATAISDTDRIAGYYYDPRTELVKAFVWHEKKIMVLPTLGGSVTVALGINDAGQTVGVAETKPETYHAFVFDGSKLTDLGTLGGDFSAARSVNNKGQIVGFSTTRPGDQSLPHGFVTENNKLTDLNTRLDNKRGWHIALATGINERGQIAATGIRGQEAHALRLDPVGENALTPEAFALLVLGGSGGVVAWGEGIARRRRRG